MNKDITKAVFFITGGGTGGHIYPAVSVINELVKAGAMPENIFYIGNKNNLEYKIALDNGFNFLSTPVVGMPRKICFKLLKFPFVLLISIIKSLFYFLMHKPDVVFATGGYVTAPVLAVAKFLNVPYVLHDSDCYPGIVTRTFARSARAVNLAFAEAEKHIKSGAIFHYNNPVRSAFFEIQKEDARKELNIGNEFTILIMGGSQGAKSINEAALKLIKKYENKKDLKIILQTGKKNYDEIISEFAPPENTRIEPYFDNMAVPIIAADLIVSRAGSISISEILSSKNPSILVPYPYAAADHQRKNAKAIEKQHAALYVEDEDLTKGELSKAVETLLVDKEKYQELKENAAFWGSDFQFASQKILKLVLNAMEKKPANNDEDEENEAADDKKDNGKKESWG